MSWGFELWAVKGYATVKERQSSLATQFSIRTLHQRRFQVAANRRNVRKEPRTDDDSEVLGNDLFKDQYESLAQHTQKGIEFLERYNQFVKDRCAIENEYANKLRKLAKTYHIKKKEEEELQFSSCKAFAQMTHEICDMAGQHELISENLTAQVIKEITFLAKELKEERKSHLQEGTKLQLNLQASLNQLEKSKKCYEKAFKESEKANDHYQKALADLHLSRIELEKSRLNNVAKLEACEECKKDYSNQLQKTNEAQRQHYTQLMPKVFQQLQDMDEKRILALQMFMKLTSDVQRKVLPVITKCLDDADTAVDSIDPKKDSALVVGRYKTGLQPPGDIPFEELIPCKTIETGTTTSITINKSDTIKNTFSSSKVKKRGGLFSIFGTNKPNCDDIKEDYSDLPPNQRRKKLQQKVEHLSTQIHQENATKDGLLKMKAAYEQNPSLGDPLSVENQLPEINSKIDKLQNQIHKFKSYLAEAEGKTPPRDSEIKNGGDSILEESLSRSASESSVHNNSKPADPVAPPPSHGNGFGVNYNSIPNADEEAEYDTSGVNEFESELLPALGTARALYPFDAQSEGSIPMEEGEEFTVVELDQGDGWTRVRRANNEEGFVPTSYIECFLYNSC